MTLDCSKNQGHPEIKTLTDTGYQGIGKIHPNSELPKKKKIDVKIVNYRVSVW